MYNQKSRQPRAPQRRATAQELDESLNRAITQAERKTKAAPEQEVQTPVVSGPISWALPLRRPSSLSSGG